MKNFKNFITENKEYASVEERINLIKKELIYDNFAIEDDSEFNERYSTLEEAWKEFVDSQELGDCQSIVSTIGMMELNGVEAVFGEIEVDNPSYEEDTEYDEEIDDEVQVEKEVFEFAHHWVTIDGKIYEFSKGTLKDYIDWEDIYSVVPDSENRYSGGIKSE